MVARAGHRVCLLAILLEVAVGLLGSGRALHEKLAREPRNGVFAVACGYGRTGVRPFVTSLRRTGYSGDIVMALAADIDDTFRKYLANNSVTVESGPCEEQYESLQKGQLLVGEPVNRSVFFAEAAAEMDGCNADNTIGDLRKPKNRPRTWLPGRFGASLCQTRFQHFKRWLERGDYDAVWLLDARDVYFEQDPFRSLKPGVSVFIDWQSKRGLPDWERGQILNCDPEHLPVVDRTSTPNLCSGTVGGTKAEMMKLLDGMIETLATTRERAECKMQDQRVLITAVAKCSESAACSQGMDIHVHDHFEGPALNVYHGRVCPNQTVPEEFLGVKGEPINKEGQAISIIHKWDLCQYFKRRVAQLIE